MTVRLWYATVYVADFKGAVAFYRDKLGLPLRFSDEEFRYAAFATEGAGFSVSGIAEDHPERAALAGRHTGIGLAVEDLSATYEEWKRRGVTFEMPPTRQPWGGTIAVLRDPEGNRIIMDQFHPGRH